MTNAEAIETLRANYPDACYEQLREAVDAAIEALKAQDATGDTVSRRGAIDAVETIGFDFSDSDLSAVELEEVCEAIGEVRQEWLQRIKRLPSAQLEKETAKRVLWSGWKGTRDTRYKCPNCKKPVKNDDVYCHRCGQKLMFPHISHTPYVPGEKQELIVRWDDE